jgi:hypothetical protein
MVAMPEWVKGTPPCRNVVDKGWWLSLKACESRFGSYDI